MFLNMRNSDISFIFSRLSRAANREAIWKDNLSHIRPVKLKELVKITLLFLHVLLKLFTILNLSGSFCISLSKKFSKKLLTIAK